MENGFQYLVQDDFRLENGDVLKEVRITYHTIGTFQPNRSKVIWVCHALTGSSDVADWWSGLFGNNAYFDDESYFVVCANCIGSCYGSTGPLSVDESANHYFTEFPLVTTRDMARAHELLRIQLRIPEIYLLIGPSLGGQQAQEFAIQLKSKLKNLVLIATNAFHSPFGIAFNEAQRLALLADPTFSLGQFNGGKKGLIAARSIAMLSYRSYLGFEKSQSQETLNKLDGFNAASYVRYQGYKLANRFNAYAYFALTKSMDSHNVGRNRISIESALGEIEAKTLVVGISSDLLFPVSEQLFLAKYIPNATFREIDSLYGHDGFLVETNQLQQLIAGFLEKSGVVRIQKRHRHQEVIEKLGGI